MDDVHGRVHHRHIYSRLLHPMLHRLIINSWCFGPKGKQQPVACVLHAVEVEVESFDWCFCLFTVVVRANSQQPPGLA